MLEQHFGEGCLFHPMVQEDGKARHSRYHGERWTLFSDMVTVGVTGVHT